MRGRVGARAALLGRPEGRERAGVLFAALPGAADGAMVRPRERVTGSDTRDAFRHSGHNIGRQENPGSPDG